MRYSGTLRTWHDERGFGFIAPTHGGAELFVHISALPRDGTRPTAGEKISYELGRGKDGRPQALKVQREVVGSPARNRAMHKTPDEPRRGGSLLLKGLALCTLLATLAYGLNHYRQQPPAAPLAASTAADLAPPPAATASAPASDRSLLCDGRKHCSQMTSCTEAKYFLRNCPGTQMDGNNDGVPCEQQWCTSPFAK
ncbi:cold shock domain-containing protein [Pelomonas sp. V22]|uniref:cold shock domain-containing protein n=1 Tax=Pelomonas sp. V22 TaxID=2822139 RepID=UPI0024A85C6E|nr:cold shock domain-containing protein [Pelomonas sp. V22]MDI4632875.1 cold shock domain-containing protein [Pelomonas sp. V22]